MTCHFCNKVKGIFMAMKHPGKLEFQKKILMQRAKIAKLADDVRTNRVRIVTARAELKALRGKRS
jgi:hypothetical protein